MIDFSYLRQAVVDAIESDSLGDKTEMVQDLLDECDAAKKIADKYRRLVEWLDLLRVSFRGSIDDFTADQTIAYIIACIRTGHVGSEKP
jgi:hypothetical protein